MDSAVARNAAEVASHLSQAEDLAGGAEDKVDIEDSVNIAKVIATSPRTEGVSDSPTSDDHMGFKPYVDALARVLLSPRTAPPFTVSLEGEWGSGKSSFMKQLATAIEKLAASRREKEASLSTLVAAITWTRPQGGETDVHAEPSEQFFRTGRLKRWVQVWRTWRAQRRKPVFVHFNAWQHDKDESLWASFALAFTRDMRLYRPDKWCWAKLRLIIARRELFPLVVWLLVVPAALVTLWAVADRLLNPSLIPDDPTELEKWWTYIKRRLPGIVPTYWITFLTALIAKVLRYPYDKFRDAPKYKDKVGFLEHCIKDFRRFIGTHQDGRRIFVFVDDLDRCEIPKAAELLQAINLMLADELPLFVVLAMDRAKVAAGVALRHKDLLSFLPSAAVFETSSERTGGSPAIDVRKSGTSYGYEFVEKFVQLSLRLPQLNTSTVGPFIDSLVSPPPRTRGGAPPAPLRSVLGDVVDTDGPAVRRALEMVAPAIGFNPRRLKKFLNLFRFRYCIAFDADALDLWTIPRLAKIVAIELYWPMLLDDLLAHRVELFQLYREARSSRLSEAMWRQPRDTELRMLLGALDPQLPADINEVVSTGVFLLYGGEVLPKPLAEG